MPIKAFRPPPPAGKVTVMRALHDMNPRLAMLGGGGGGIDISEPLPVFRLGLNDLTEPDVLSRAEFVGWRYLVEGGGPGTAMADLGEPRGGSPFFASLSRNEQADFLLEAAHIAQAEADATAQDCEIRILLIPALYTSTIWLTTDPSTFIPFLDVARPIRSASDVRPQPTFLARLIVRAREQRGSHNTASPSMSGP